VLKKCFAVICLFTITLLGGSCGGGTSLLSIQVLPVDPTILNNNTAYVTPGGIVQYQIQGWYSNRTTSTTIPSSQGHWVSTQPAVATVDNNGLVTSVGPVGVTTIVVTVSGQKSTATFSVCTLSSLCPPVCNPTSCP
jgi:hypothetical protein